MWNQGVEKSVRGVSSERIPVDSMGQSDGRMAGGMGGFRHARLQGGFENSSLSARGSSDSGSAGTASRKGCSRVRNCCGEEGTSRTAISRMQPQKQTGAGLGSLPRRNAVLGWSVQPFLALAFRRRSK